MYICEACGTDISIHALREEGDGGGALSTVKGALFLSTPSARRATLNRLAQRQTSKISIHALREEGDCNVSGPAKRAKEFLSTPSARRATSRKGSRRKGKGHFYPRPPRGGRLTLTTAAICR